MHQLFLPDLQALVTIDGEGQVRSITYLDQPSVTEARSPEALAVEHLATDGKHYGIRDEQLRNAESAPAERLTEDQVEYRLRGRKRVMDITTLDFVQTVFGIPVWRAGIAVQVKDRPRGVIGSNFTGRANIEVEQPEPESVERMLRITPGQLAEFLHLEKLAQRLRNGELLPPRINHMRLWVYHYRIDERLPPYTREQDLAFESCPTLPLPPIPETIVDGKDYVVIEVLFTVAVRPWGELNWRALIEPRTGAVLYLHALVAHVQGLVFPNDPVTLSGTATNRPSANAATLDPLRQSVVLLGLDPPTAGVQSLSGEFVRVQDAYTPNVLPPTRATGSDFDFGSRTNDYAAVNAYYHCDYCFRLVDGMGLNSPAAYFDGTAFPVPVDHRGSFDIDGIFGGPTNNNGNQVNAQSLGNTASNGLGLLNFFLADITDTANPLGIACDRRVVLHEFGHAILWDHIDRSRFGFAHSAGDSLAAILSDPDGSAPDRFETLPFTSQSLPAFARRRHDRAVGAGWAWGGTKDDPDWSGPENPFGYSSEQILSTTLFRFYRSIGGDSGYVERRRLAARIAAYLIFRAVGMLTPAAYAPTATDFAQALINADAGEWTSEGLAGGAYHKVIRWAFEKQGLYQRPGAPTPVTTEVHRLRSTFTSMMAAVANTASSPTTGAPLTSGTGQQ